MGWFSWLPWNRRRELEKLEAEVRRNMTPAAICTLVDKYQQQGEVNNAIETARRAIDRFPDSPAIRDMHVRVMRLHNQNALNKLHKELETRPTAQTFVRLSELYMKEMNDLNRALELGADGLSRFPDDEDLHLINGWIRLARYQSGRLASDGLKCVEHLEAATRANPMNYKALATLTRLLTEVGAYDRAMIPLNAIMRFAPEDASASSLIGRLQGLPPLGTDLEDLFKTVERSSGPTPENKSLADAFPAEATKASLAARVDEALAGQRVADFKRVDGVRAALVMDQGGKVVGSLVQQGSAAELAEVVHAIYAVSEDSSRRMDIGSFKRGILEAPGMRLHMTEAGGHVIAVITTKSTRDEVIRNAMNSFIDSVLKA